MRLRPIIGDRDFHHPQQQSSDLAFAQIVGTHQIFLQAFHANKPGTPWQLRWSHGHYQPEETWLLELSLSRGGGAGIGLLGGLVQSGLSHRLDVTE